jgi:hypothetical protein
MHALVAFKWHSNDAHLQFIFSFCGHGSAYVLMNFLYHAAIFHRHASPPLLPHAAVVFATRGIKMILKCVAVALPLCSGCDYVRYLKEVRQNYDVSKPRWVCETCMKNAPALFTALNFFYVECSATNSFDSD